MYVTMCQLFVRGWPEGRDPHVKMQRLPRQRMIKVELHAIGANLIHMHSKYLP